MMKELKAKIAKEITELWQEGLDILSDEAKEQGSLGKTTEMPDTVKGEESDEKLPLHIRYQSWYSKALPVVRQVLPERYEEFRQQYIIDKRKDKEIDFLTYTISDYLIGLRITRGYFEEEVVNPYRAFATKFQHQIFILYSALERIASILCDIEGVLQSQLFSNELHAAEELLKKNHLRASGALAGVTLEAHLSKVAQNHEITLRKKSPTVADYSEALKNGEVIDIPTWRLIQRLGDIRNLCVHAKEREPTNDEIDDLIRGVKKLIAALF